LVPVHMKRWCIFFLKNVNCVCTTKYWYPLKSILHSCLPVLLNILFQQFQFQHKIRRIIFIGP
jgi:hypothetical protein